jgi:hypothetical protein
MKQIVLGIVAFGLMVGCSSISVNSDYSVDADFSTFKTFQYQSSANNVEASAPLAHQRIVAAIREGMSSSGLTEVDADPDVFVTYYGATENQLRFVTTYTGVSNWHRPGWGSSMGMMSATTQSTTVTEGTIVIDIWDASSNTLVWRGIATSPLSRNPDRNTSKINSAIERIFRNFPPS